MQPRILYPAIISFKIEGEIFFFQQTKAKRIHLYKTQAKRNIERASLNQKRKEGKKGMKKKKKGGRTRIEESTKRYQSLK